ncbi:MAG: hypothetical protein KBB83_05700 [Alphaproteobacteria bacterium]|nr:hypothetical protein [Alphaproteobacteria bacterium]
MKKTVYVGTLLLNTLTSDGIASKDAIQEFEGAWNNPDFTHYEAIVADVNKLIALETDVNLNKHRLTGEQLWDAEKKKAWDPQTYIPHAVIKGESYDRSQPNEDEVTFKRRSEQRSWLDPNVIVPVLEEVHIFEKLRKAVFLGRAVDDADSIKGQPIFHVEHSVGGSEDNPLSLWRIIMLTPDAKYVQTVESIMTQRLQSLPRFVAEYLKRDM